MVLPVASLISAVVIAGFFQDVHYLFIGVGRYLSAVMNYPVYSSDRYIRHFSDVL